MRHVLFSTLKDLVSTDFPTLTKVANTSVLFCCQEMIGSLLTPGSRRALFSLALLVSRPQASLAFAPTGLRPYSSSTSLAMSKKVLVPIGDGSEEIETTCITDTLARFGADVTIASVMNGELVCKMSRGIKVSFTTEFGSNFRNQTHANSSLFLSR